MTKCAGCGNETRAAIFQRGKGHLCMGCAAQTEKEPPSPSPVTLGDLILMQGYVKKT